MESREFIEKFIIESKSDRGGVFPIADGENRRRGGGNMTAK